jgi:hypothetical protein
VEERPAHDQETLRDRRGGLARCGRNAVFPHAMFGGARMARRPVRRSVADVSAPVNGDRATAVADATGARDAPLLIERLLPRPDAVRAEHLLVDGEPGAVYAAVRQADFMRAWRESRAVRFLFAARTLGERAVSAAAGRDRPPEPPPPETMRLADLPAYGEWVVLGEDPPHEIAFGAIGRFWLGETVWEPIDAARFASFDRPGVARIACDFSLRPYGSGRTLVSYECRTQATDPDSRRAFLRYWRPLSPFIGVVLRSQLRVVAHPTERTPHG